MKKILSILLVAMLVVTCLTTAAFATETKATVSIDNKTITPGTNTVDIVYTVTGSFANFELKVEAGEGLTLTNIVAVNTDNGYFQANLKQGSAKFGKVAYGKDSLTEKVTFKATFSVSDAKCGSKYDAKATVYFVSGTDLVDQAYTVEGGKITVPHTPGSVVVENNVAPTCTAAGSYDNVVYCTVCKCEISRDTVTVPAKGHTAGAAVVENEVAATCTADGSYESVVYCTVCKCEMSRETVTVPAKGHTAGAVVVEKNVAPTCTADGSYDNVVYCTVCKCEMSRETVTVPAKGHAWGEEGVVTTEPGCLTTGVMTYTCSVCDATKTETLEALGHAYVQSAGTATCTEGGWVTWTCSRCGDSYTEDETAALGHDYVLVDSKAATCTEAGYEKYECSRCGDEYKDDLNALGHQWCEDFECELDHEHYDEEQHWYLCTLCGEKKDVEDHVHDTELNGYLYCECTHKIPVPDDPTEPGRDPEPESGDMGLVMFAGFAALIAMMAAAAYVYKRKFAK